MASLPVGTVTFLFTDIEGSTRLVQDLGDRWADVLTEHRRLLRAAVLDGHGHEVDTAGDGFFASFARARDAVTAAVLAQRALIAHTWPEHRAVRVRMGLHTGEPLRAEGGYAGLDVHRAARIAGAAHGRQVLLSASTHALVADELPPGVGLKDLGEHRLRDLTRPQHLFQVIAVDLPLSFRRCGRSTPCRTISPASSPASSGASARSLTSGSSWRRRSCSRSLAPGDRARRGWPSRSRPTV